jgi:superoxide reductase
MKLFKGANGELVQVVLPADENIEIAINGAPAQELAVGVTDGATEKHVPAVSKEGDLLKVVVGDVKHPMLDAHYITNIFVEYPDGTVESAALKPGEEPEAIFNVAGKEGTVSVYEYCNLHGLWKKDFTL